MDKSDTAPEGGGGGACMGWFLAFPPFLGEREEREGKSHRQISLPPDDIVPAAASGAAFGFPLSPTGPLWIEARAC